MNEPIKVAIRIRPLNQLESAADHRVAWRVIDGVSIALDPPRTSPHQKASNYDYEFAKAFPPNTDNYAVYLNFVKGRTTPI